MQTWLPVSKKREYASVSASEVSTEQDHISSTDKLKLENLLKDFDVVFDGKLKLYPHEQIHLGLIPGSVPLALAQRPYAVAHKNEEVFKDELKHLCNEEVLKEAGLSE